MSGESFEPRCAVVLAGRRGTDDPLADADGAPHRALLDIEGEPMLLRVVRCLLARKGLDRVFVNIDAPELLDAYPLLLPGVSQVNGRRDPALLL